MQVGVKKPQKKNLKVEGDGRVKSRVPALGHHCRLVGLVAEGKDAVRLRHAHVLSLRVYDDVTYV
jgi:hypothetical protein